MATVEELIQILQRLAPLELAEDWDNVGLLVGSTATVVGRVMTCLTVTPGTVREAISEGAQLIVTHHPFPFRSLKKITDAEPVGRMLLDILGHGIAIYSAHTAFDSAQGGINQQLAESLGLEDVLPLCEPTELDANVGLADAVHCPNHRV